MIPEEPQLYILSLDTAETDFEVDPDDMLDKDNFSAITEKLGYKEVIRFNQKTLHPKCICLLDFGSEAFIWFGSQAPDD